MTIRVARMSQTRVQARAVAQAVRDEDEEERPEGPARRTTMILLNTQTVSAERGHEDHARRRTRSGA